MSSVLAEFTSVLKNYLISGDLYTSLSSYIINEEQSSYEELESQLSLVPGEFIPYLTSLAILKLFTKSPLDLNLILKSFIENSTKMEIFFSNSSDYYPHLITYFVSTAIENLQQYYTLKVIISTNKLLIYFNCLSEEYIEYMNEVFNDYYSKKLKKMKNELKPSDLLKMCSGIVQGQQIGLVCSDSISEILMVMTMNYIESAYDLHDVQEDGFRKQNFYMNWESGAYLIRLISMFSIYQKFAQKIEDIYSRFNSKSKEISRNVDELQIPEGFCECSNNPMTIDVSLIQYTDCGFCIIKGIGYKMMISNAIYNNQILIEIREYKLMSSTTKPLVKQELEIANHLSDLSSSKNCFRKIYGHWEINGSVYIALEYAPLTLIEALTQYKNKNLKLPEQFLKSIIIRLIRSFITIESLNFYYSNISPHNIFVTPNWDLKLYNFPIKGLKAVAESWPYQGEILQNPHGYTAPEVNLSQLLNSKDQKSIVYSLGLCVLQILLLDSIQEMSLISNSLQARISDIEYEWGRALLNNMLCYSSKERLNFTELLKLLKSYS